MTYLKEYVVEKDGKETLVTTDPKEGLTEILKQKYILGYDVTKTKHNDSEEDTKIAEYIANIDPSLFDIKKTERIIVERVHKNKSKHRKVRYFYRYKPAT